ncbi:ATP-binding cassette domain-containing protein [Streptomyces sp. NPDC006314]|uniref:ATP-binding cassette domain-containing protein n=1 Tax=Streptomyces sp. NPDC006314 TaxID=3154475 RepID=UPI0033A53E2C
MSDAVISIERLRKRFGPTTAVDDVSFSVSAGSVVGLLGPNGAGKTTLINCLTTLLTPDGGTASVAGHDLLSDPHGVRACLAVTGQFAAVDESLTGRENLVFFARLLGLSKPRAAARAEELLDRFGLAESAGRPVGQYSGGMRRKLDLAVGLVVPRPVLILDEPTTGLDPRSRETLWDAVRALAADGMAILLTTQYLDEADALADRIVVIDHGRVIAQGSPRELKQQTGGSVCEVIVADDSARARAAELLGASTAVHVRDDCLVIPVGGMEDLGGIIDALNAGGIRADDVAVHAPTLNDVFFALTADRQGTTGPTADRPVPEARA